MHLMFFSCVVSHIVLNRFVWFGSKTLKSMVEVEGLRGNEVPCIERYSPDTLGQIKLIAYNTIFILLCNGSGCDPLAPLEVRHS